MNDAAKIVADFLSLVPADRAERVNKALMVVFSEAPRNVEFKNAKHVLDSAADAAFDAATGHFWHGKMGKLDADYATNEVLNTLQTNVNLSYVRDAIAASKKIAKIKVQHPMVEAYRAVIAKILPLAQAMEANKTKVVKGRANAIPSGYVRTRENTGTCPVCFRNIKMTDAQKMVHHGYERPGHGYIVGDCFGVGYKPYELSSEGTEAFLRIVLRPMLANQKKHLRALKSGQITEFKYQTQDRTKPREPGTYKFPTMFVTVKKGDEGKNTEPGIHPSFEYLLDSDIRETEYRVKGLTGDIAEMDKLVADWKPAPLPATGSLVKDGK